MAISPYRLVLVITVLPCLGMWLTGKAGRILPSDIAILLYCLWCMVSLTVIHGFRSAPESGGIIFIETAGAYLLGRCSVRSAYQFYAMARLLFWIVAILLPFAAFEALSNWNVSLDLFAKLFPTHVLAVNVPRWGLRRVQTVFEHPILFGVSCGGILAAVHLVLGEKQSPLRRWSASAIVWTTAFLSLSAGPLTALAVQTMLISWNWLLHGYQERWRILWAVLFANYIFISFVSNQTVPEFYLTHFSFDQESAYYRVLIWHFGSESALNHPLFGVGFNRWDRPDWMPGSIDMFWLYHAVLFGIPAGVLMLFSFLLLAVAVSFKKGLDEKLIQYRTAYLIVMIGYFLVGWTVHFWNATYVLFLFLLGSGSWLLDAGADDGSTTRSPLPRRPAAIPQTHRRKIITRRV
ncbi:O-antigen ligase family protein [Sinorhizobium sojae]|nr:O-antigen polymerase [Sinorhizobium sojae]